MQKTEPEQTCTFAVSMRVIDDVRFTICQTFVCNLFFVAQDNWFTTLLMFQKTSNQDVQYLLRISGGVVLTTSDASLD